MNIQTLIAAMVASVLLVACAGAPVKPPGAAEARSKLTQLQADPALATLAPVAIKEAEIAVSAAEQPEDDVELAAHRVYIAERKVDTAISQAEIRYAEDQRTVLSEQRESARLAARTREADIAKSQAAMAAADSARQKSAADLARAEADAAHMAAANSEEQSVELQKQIDELQARPTDRGLVLTLGDVLFSSGMSDLNMSATSSLEKLAAFLNHYPTRNAIIEGHTDSVGSDDYNQGLSQRRANSVKSYLVGHNIGATRLTATGMGESQPLAGNDSATGRQQNRRVEVIIDNPALASN